MGIKYNSKMEIKINNNALKNALNNLEKNPNKSINIVIEDDWDTFHDDDTDHFHSGPVKVSGKLIKVYSDGIVLTDSNHGGYPRRYWEGGVLHYESYEGKKESYFPFCYNEQTHLSRTDTRIISISSAEEADEYTKP